MFTGWLINASKGLTVKLPTWNETVPEEVDKTNSFERSSKRLPQLRNSQLYMQIRIARDLLRAERETNTVISI